MTPNIGILYTVGNDFLPQLIKQDSYLKMRPRLVHLHCQSFDNLSRKTYFEIWPFSAQTKVSITIVGSIGTSWNQEWWPKLTGCGGSTYAFTAFPHMVDRTNAGVLVFDELRQLVSASSKSCWTARGVFERQEDKDRLMTVC